MAQHPTSRRSFLSAGSLGFLGLTLSEYLSAAASSSSKAPVAGKANSVILFWLEGGPSHIDTWDPKKNSNFKPISTNVAGIQSFRTFAEDGKADGQVRACPFDAHARNRSSAGNALCDHRA